MPEQATLFDDLYSDKLAESQPPEPKYRPRPKVYETRRKAAEFIANLKPGKRKEVYDFLLQRGDQGATDQEIQDALQMGESTQRPRRKELEEADVICASGRTRPTRSGLPAVVWVVVERS